MSLRGRLLDAWGAMKTFFVVLWACVFVREGDDVDE